MAHIVLDKHPSYPGMYIIKAKDNTGFSKFTISNNIKEYFRYYINEYIETIQNIL